MNESIQVLDDEIFDVVDGFPGELGGNSFLPFNEAILELKTPAVVTMPLNQHWCLKQIVRPFQGVPLTFFGVGIAGSNV